MFHLLIQTHTFTEKQACLPLDMFVNAVWGQMAAGGSVGRRHILRFYLFSRED